MVWHRFQVVGCADTVDTFPEFADIGGRTGHGVLTQFLVKKDRLVKVVEVDYESVAYLREAYPSLEITLSKTISENESSPIRRKAFRGAV